MQGYSPGPQIVESDAPHCCVQTAPFSGGAAFRAEISASSIRLRGGKRADTLGSRRRESLRGCPEEAVGRSRSGLSPGHGSDDPLVTAR